MLNLLINKICISFLERTKERAISYAKEQTLFLSQFEEGKIYTSEVIFKNEETNTHIATLLIKIQYVKDEKNLINKIIGLFENKRKLLSVLLKNCVREIKKLQRNDIVEKGENPQDENSSVNENGELSLLNKVKGHSMISWGSSSKPHSFAGIVFVLNYRKS